MTNTNEREWVSLGSGCADARDLKFEGVPESIVICPFCHGNGKRRQRYIEGRMTGRCDFCDVSGFVYRDTSRGVPESVLNQIAVASGLRYRRYEMYGIDWY